ncbi:hypothetical protein Desku_1142 [Desulfofundulus kuznetsovii DSM 6115]|uniref:Uncharacterized protein n=1 Tax=Desulfofundulus kuznetsovii (strain DSM 6115 / VKM B-1805 / 17) TaxID=760568 RepID=A0AAU8PSG9_DESK7|nr:hypothetical protein Desku_1142 [Desulfofundulus kuznetsovii DSM 6115]
MFLSYNQRTGCPLLNFAAPLMPLLLIIKNRFRVTEPASLKLNHHYYNNRNKYKHQQEYPADDPPRANFFDWERL